MRHENHAALTSSELAHDILKGATVYDTDDHKIGTVDHLHGDGTNKSVVIDVGGFLGIGAKPVSVALSGFNFMRSKDGTVHAVTSWSKDQLKELPEHHD